MNVQYLGLATSVGAGRLGAEGTTLNALEDSPVVCRARVRLLFTAHQVEAA